MPAGATQDLDLESEHGMKKLLPIGILVLFVGFWMVQSPDSLARFAQNSADWIWTMTTTIFGSIIDFLNALFD